MFWLVYRQGHARAVLIQAAGSLIMARLKTDMAFRIDEHFVEGHELPPGSAKAGLPIGRLMLAGEAARALGRLEATLPD